MRVLPVFFLVLLTACGPGRAPGAGGVAPILGDRIETTTLAPIPSAQVAIKPTAEIAPKPAPKPPEPQPAPKSAPSSPEEAQCRADGGRWASAGKAKFMTCFRPSKDAGKSCARQGDCSTQCLARSRTCAPIWPMFGCNDVLQMDGRLVKLCID